jgi:hypothetical protein
MVRTIPPTCAQPSLLTEIGSELGLKQIDNADLRSVNTTLIGRAAQARSHRIAKRNTRGISPRNASFVDGLVQQRDGVVCITGDKDRTAFAPASMRIHGLRSRRIVTRHTFAVELDRRILQADALDVGHSASGNQNVVKRLYLPGAIGSGAMNYDAVPVAANVRNVSVGLQREFLLEDGYRASEDLRIAERADAVTAPKYRDTDSQSMQRLPQLKADDSRADHGHGLRQIPPIEYIVTDDEALAEGVERIRAGRTRAGRDDGRPGNHARMLIDLKRMVVHETGMAAKAVRFGNAFNVAQHEADEPVALAPHPLHDCAPVDAHDTIMMHTEGGRGLDGVGCIRGGDEQLARHAADARAGGAVGTAFDEHCGRPCSPGSAVGGNAGRPGADDGDVNLRDPSFASSLMAAPNEKNDRGKDYLGRNTVSLTFRAKGAARETRIDLKTCRIAPSRC